jgi:hypothetical protein
LGVEVMVTEVRAVSLVIPSLKVTRKIKVMLGSPAPRVGAVKLGVAVFAPVKDTVGLPICVQE